MQQTTTYKLNLIEADDVFSPEPLSENARKVDAALSSTASALAAETVAMGLKDYVGAFGNVDWGSTFAAIAISILPPLLIYFALNKWVTAGMTMGATKG